MIVPLLQDEALLAQVKSYAEQADNNLRIWWLGQSGFLVQWQGHHLLLDPYLSDSLTHKYAATAKPHVRMTQRVIAPELLDMVEVVTSSHNHTDHLDAETLQPLLQANPEVQMVVPEANRALVAERTGRPLGWPVGLTAGEACTLGPWQLTALAAAHNELDTDEQGRHKYLGFVVKVGHYALYHSGDTLEYPGLEATLRALGPLDVALVPINGNVPERGVAGNLSGPEAASLSHRIGARWAVPHHFEMFEFNTASPQPFEEACNHLGQAFRVLRAGEMLEISC